MGEPRGDIQRRRRYTASRIEEFGCHLDSWDSWDDGLGGICFGHTDTFTYTHTHKMHTYIYIKLYIYIFIKLYIYK